LKIIYLAEVHGTFQRVKTLLSEDFADLYIVAGDLIDIPFYNMNTAINYHELQSYFHGLRLKMNKEKMRIEDFVEELLDRPDLPKEIEEKGTKYQQHTIRARRVLHQKYQVLENILSRNFEWRLKEASVPTLEYLLTPHSTPGLLTSMKTGLNLLASNSLSPSGQKLKHICIKTTAVALLTAIKVFGQKV
jgi:hypothetical protein